MSQQYLPARGKERRVQSELQTFNRRWFMSQLGINFGVCIPTLLKGHIYKRMGMVAQMTKKRMNAILTVVGKLQLGLKGTTSSAPLNVICAVGFKLLWRQGGD